MEIKKSPKADLEGKKQMSLLMGYVIALAILFVAFEWGTQDISVSVDDGIATVIEEEEIEITRQEEEPVMPPPQIEIKVPEIFDIVDDNVELEQEDILSSEDDMNTAQLETYTPPAAQEEEEEDPNQVYVNVEKMPSFPGGNDKIIPWIRDHTNYPPTAAENGIQGTVVVMFTIEKDGKVTNAKVLRPIDPALDREALRVINSMPTWTPGEQRGKKVRVSFQIPVRFYLRQ